MTLIIQKSMEAIATIAVMNASFIVTIKVGDSNFIIFLNKCRLVDLLSWGIGGEDKNGSINRNHC